MRASASSARSASESWAAFSLSSASTFDTQHLGFSSCDRLYAQGHRRSVALVKNASFAVFTFLGAVYFVCCFSLSRLGQRLGQRPGVIEDTTAV